MMKLKTRGKILTIIMVGCFILLYGTAGAYEMDSITGGQMVTRYLLLLGIMMFCKVIK